MSEMQSDPASNTETEGIRLEDALILVEIVKKALEYRPFIKEGVFGSEWSKLSWEQQVEEMVNPRIGIFFLDRETKKVPGIFLRIVGDETPLVEAFFYPFEAAKAFLSEARSFINLRKPTEWTEEAVERRAFDFAVDMMLIMIDNLYQRSSLMMRSFTDETIAQWLSNMDQDALRWYSEQGIKVNSAKNLLLRKGLKAYSDSLKKMWKYQGQSQGDSRKIRLVEEYEVLLRHWRKLLRMVVKDEADWREYAKAGKYGDTPDDLLTKLENIERGNTEAVKTRVSELAIEHAARRAGVLKTTGVSAWARGKREEGVKVTDYSATQLFTFLQDGKRAREESEKFREVQRRLSTYPKPEENLVPATEKKRKLLEQKLDFIKENLASKPEQDSDSAQEKES